jgi:hypothetical protein
MLGAFFDDAVENQPALIKVAAAAVLIGCVTNLSVLSWDTDWIPYLENDGYNAFVEQNEKRLGENVIAIVYGTPILNFYASQHKPQFTGTSLNFLGQLSPMHSFQAERNTLWFPR